MDDIKYKISTIREHQVMLDSDLAELYNVPVKVLNQAVKRNKDRFPSQFCFQLNEDEFRSLRSQIVTTSAHLRYQTGSSRHGGRRYLPYVFTEQGVAMLSAVLRSDTAVCVSINIMNAFVAMRRFISKNADLFARLDVVEQKQLKFQQKAEDNFEKVFKAIEDKTFQKKQGIFFEGQVFDAHVFVSDLIRSAKISIVLIDNFIDDSVLTLFSKKNRGVQISIYTKNIPKSLILDVEKFNTQYGFLELKEFKQSHDRFMIIDNRDVFHIGASLKDLGKRWFAFSKFDKNALALLEKLY